MGVAIYPIVEGDEPGSSEICGKLLAKHHDEIWEHVETENLRPLFDFYVPDDADLEEFGIETPGGDEWFLPADGLATVKAMHDYMKTNPDRYDRSEDLMQDLNDFRVLLEQAAEKGKRWRLGLDY